MKLSLEPQYSLNDIRERFSQFCPAVKIEFSFKGNEAFHQLNFSGKPFAFIRLGELVADNKNEQIAIDENMTIEQVEALFLQHYGLPVQLYVQKGGYWLKTGLHDAIRLSEFHTQ